MANRSVDVEFKGFAHDHRLTLHGTGYIGEDPIRVFIRGHYAPTVEYGDLCHRIHPDGSSKPKYRCQIYNGSSRISHSFTPLTGTVPIPEPLPYDTPVELFQ